MQIITSLWPKHRFLLAVLGVAVATSLPAFGRGYGRPQAQKTPTVDVPPVDGGAAAQARQTVTAAREAVQKAEADLAVVANKLRADFNTTPDMAAATAEFKSAQSAYEKTSRPILDKMHDSDEYKAAQAAHDQDEAKLTELRGSNSSGDALSSVALDALAQSSTLTKLDSYALEADPATAAAKAKMSQAGAKMAALQAGFNASLPQNPQWAAAKKTLDDARQSLETASAALRDASTKLASEQAAHNAAAAQQQKLDQEHPPAPAANQNN